MDARDTAIAELMSVKTLPGGMVRLGGGMLMIGG